MLIVLYGCFVALLGKETFFRLNRIVLLSIIMSVLIIPALNITLPKPDFSDIWDEELSYTPINTEPLNPIPLDIVDEESSAEATQMPLIPSEEQILIEYPEEPTPFPWHQIIIGIYLLGLAWRVGLFVWQMLLFSKEIKRGVRHRDQYGNKITILSGDFVPYSFFHHIVISVKDYEQMRTPILVHEQAHAKLGHSWDIMLLEILCAIQWFNPFCYMLARELRCVHEYEADNEVLNHGIDATQYQQLLLIKAVGKQLQSFANNFNRNSLKKRIIMMNKQKSNKRLMLRGLFLPLALVIAVIAYAKPKIENHMGDNYIELFPIDTAQLNSAYRTLSINPDNKEAQEQFFKAFPKNWSEFIITYQYDDSEDYDLTMYFLADDHITTLGEKLTLIDKYTYYKRLISLGIGGSWDADAPNYLKSLLHSKMKENTTTMLECLSQLDREKQLQFWTFYWSYGHYRDTEITDPEYNLLLTENETKFPIAMETMKQVYTADEESKKQVQNTINDIHSKAERMARSGQRNTSKLTEEYATQEFKDIYNLVDTWGKQHNTALIPYDCWLRLYNANSPTYTAQEIDVYHHNGRQLASIIQIITDTINGQPISHKSVVYMTPINGKWKVFDFQDFDTPSYTELVKLAHKEALLAKEKSKENTQEGQTENNTELENETLTPNPTSTLNQLPNSKAACYINDIFVKSFVGINPLVEADTKVEINK